ncbi:myosin heavy chain 9/10/11/14 [Nematocida minor]|uniref:myosin heavy chain 9/10/11/14 n=1 Tax=Nematocida minor TaxID=1912983 RepID=UPI002220C1AB|nr:myosin heavy chain 9/10/11/14 [Nematocida minor]KAI5190821.1 myosin heavy chain 9/10/11/14 [Nematocida minor]
MNKGETKTQSHRKSEDIGDKLEPQNATKKLVWWINSDNEYQLGQIVAEDSTHAEITIGEKRFSVRLEDLNKANPSKFDLVDNMAHLSYLNEPSILHNLHQRYLSDMQYTYSGLFLVAINPYKSLPIYTKDFIEKYSSVYKREDAPPHIYAVASEAYHLMRNTKQPQTILITGESGAGKTENTKHAIAFLTKVSGDLSHGTSVLEERLRSTNPLLEAFGNAQTGRNDNSSRFGKFIKIEFGASGEIVGASVERYLLESSRVTKQAKGERNYHVFYALTKQADDALLSSLHLSRDKPYRIINSTEGNDIEMESIYTSMRILGITEEEKDKIFKILAAIIHLGEVDFIQDGKCVSLEAEGATALEHASNLLGVDAGMLKETLLSPKIQAGHEIVVHGRSPQEANFTVASLCKVLYERLFDWIVSLVNASLKPKAQSQSYIGVLDIAGFEILEKNGFEQLCINYTNEKLQQFFNHRMFVLEQDIYLKEGLEWNMIDFGLDLQPTIDLLETSGTGIFSILDEECVVPGGTGDRLLDKISRTWKSHGKFSIPKVRGGFTVKHYAGKVCYNEDGWIAKNKDPLDEAISSLMLGPKGPLPTSSTRSGLAATRFRTVSQSHKEQLAALLKMLYTTNPHFVRCILPNRSKKANSFEVSRVLHQLRCNGVLEGVRISRQGFPTRVEFRDFTQRYALLSRSGKEHIPPAEKGVVALLTELGVPSSLFRLGKTRLFLRQGVLADLEDHRNAKISGLIADLQRRLRTLLSINSEKLKKAREDAVSLIQKNVKIYAAVRNWSWWKLCMKVRPLLEVRKAEDEIKERDIKIARQCAEIQELKDKIFSMETKYGQTLQETQLALAQSEETKRLAKIEKAEAEKSLDELKSELASAQKASNKHFTRANEMKQIVEDLEVKVEQARKDAASEITKKLLAELASLKTAHTESIKEAKELREQLQHANNKLDSSEHEKGIFAQERDTLCEKNKKLANEIEELQNEVKVAESKRHKGEVSLRKSESEIERLSSLLSFEKEKLQKLNEAFKRASAPAPAPIAPPVQDNKEELMRLEKELEHEKERSESRQKEYEELKREYIDLVDEKLGTMISDRQKLDVEMKKLQQALAHNQLKLQQTEESAVSAQSLLSAAQAQKKEEKEKRKLLEKEISARKAEEIKMKQEIAMAKEETVEILEKMQSEKKDWELENSKRVKAQDSIISELHTSISNVEEINTHVQQLSNKVSSSMEVISLYKAEIKRISEDLVKCESEKAKIAQKLARALSNAKESESSLAWAASQVNALSHEKERILKDVEAEICEQRDKYENAESVWQKEKKALEAEKRQLQKDLKEKERSSASLSLLQKEMEHLQKKLGTARQEAQKLAEEKESAYTESASKMQEMSAKMQKETAESVRYKREVKVLAEAQTRTEAALSLSKSKENKYLAELQSMEETALKMQEREKELLLEIRKLTLDKTASEIIKGFLSDHSRTTVK